MRIGSLFSGVGGLEIGLEWAGLGETVWQVENDAHGMSEPTRFAFCRRVLERHWPNAERFGDIRSVGASLPDVDIICGGFPCTSISNAGKRLGITGPHSNLWKEMARVISIKRPRAVVVENVRALRTRGLDVVLADLDALGYQTVALDIGAWQVGAPHRRDRGLVSLTGTATFTRSAMGRRGWPIGTPTPIPSAPLDPDSAFTTAVRRDGAFAPTTSSPSRTASTASSTLAPEPHARTGTHTHPRTSTSTRAVDASVVSVTATERGGRPSGDGRGPSTIFDLGAAS